MDLFGVFEHHLDSKGRLIMPSKWRRLKSLVLTEDSASNSCLIFPRRAWDRIPDEEKKKFLFWFEARIDRQGRLAIPLLLRSRFQPRGRRTLVVLQGRSNQIVIWEESRWRKHCQGGN